MTHQTPSIVLAAYGTPGILAIEHLLARGYLPDQIGLLTHAEDDRNRPLLARAAGLAMAVCQSPATDPAAEQWVRSRKPEALFSLHYRDRIPGSLLSIPLRGCVNLHPSLLPRHRGCFSIPWAILEGDRMTGFTYHWMTEHFDEGNILVQRTIPIGEDETAYALFHRLIVEGLNAFPEVLEQTLAGERGTPQQMGGSYHPREVPFGGVIDPAWDRERIGRFIRALTFPPYPPAMLNVSGKMYPVPSLEAFDRLLSVHTP